MKTVWKLISVIALAGLTLGVVCIVVGLITGGSTDRIIDTVFANYDVDRYIELWTSVQAFVQSIFTPV